MVRMGVLTKSLEEMVVKIAVEDEEGGENVEEDKEVSNKEYLLAMHFPPSGSPVPIRGHSAQF
jgi:hypothetical protein